MQKGVFLGQKGCFKGKNGHYEVSIWDPRIAARAPGGGVALSLTNGNDRKTRGAGGGLEAGQLMLRGVPNEEDVGKRRTRMRA